MTFPKIEAAIEAVPEAERAAFTEALLVASSESASAVLRAHGHPVSPSTVRMWRRYQEGGGNDV